jgi:hypothetical protein
VPQLGHVLRLTQSVKFNRLQPHMQRAIQYGNRCRHSTSGAHIIFDQTGGFHILRERHAMSDNRAFKRHNRLSCGSGSSNFGAVGNRDHNGVSPET